MRKTIERLWPRRLFFLLLLSAAVVISACGGVSDSGISPRYSVSGVITAAANSAVDGDVNDSQAGYADNSTFLNAQPIPNPVVLGGYVNIAGCGPDGRSRQQGDVKDYYLISLQSGQTVTLLVSRAVSTTLQCGVNRLSLALYRQADVENGDTTPLQTATALSDSSATINVPALDNYILEVRAVQGASNYTLTTGLPSAAAAGGAPLARDFVPGEVLVRFKGGGDSPAVTGVRRRAGSLGMDVVSGGSGGPALLRLRPGNDPLQSLGVARRPVAGDPERQLELDTLTAVQALRRRADVASADFNYIRRPLVQPNDTYFGRQWDAGQINLPKAWDSTKGSPQVIVAVLDSGVLPDHPDLQGKLTGGYDFISDPQNAMDGDGIDPDPTDPGDHALGARSSFHGTHVTGIVAAATDNGIGVAGGGWQTRVMPLRVLGKVGGTSADICQALRFAARLDNDSGTLPPQRADIVNMSFGGPGFSQTEQDCISSARNAGVILVAAAGNNADSAPEYPASYSGVVSVDAVNLSGVLASYSNYGPDIDAAAPGGELSGDVNGDGYPDGILSTLGDDSSGQVVYTYGYYAGTSMAAPHVAAVAALMKAVYPGLTPPRFDNMLNSGQLTDDLGASGRDDNYGQGLINAYKAVAAAAAAGGTAGLPPLLTVNPPALNLGLTRPGGTLTVANAGGSGLSVSAPTEDSGGWLKLTPVTVGLNGVGSYAVSVDRTNMAAGTYTAKVSFTSNGGDAAVQVIMGVPSANISLTADAGYQYVLLVDPATGKTVETVSVPVSNGTYAYRFDLVRKGKYQVVAGTDMNNDGYICETGEACGAYTTLDLPSIISVDGSRSGIDFESGFFSYLNASAAGLRPPGHGYAVTAPEVGP